MAGHFLVGGWSEAEGGFFPVHHFEYMVYSGGFFAEAPWPDSPTYSREDNGYPA
jgi:hypothetical protein